MKKMILVIIVTISAASLFAQKRNADSLDNRPQNNINLNLFGDASWISINYEKLFFISSSFFLTGKFGIGYNEEYQIQICFGSCSSSPTPPEKYLTIPHHITGNLGKRRHFFEFGLGGTIINGNTNQNYLLYPILGYRIQPLNSNKVDFRIFGSIPFSGINTKDILFIPFGLNLGIGF